MANTLTLKTLHGDSASKRVVRELTLASDGTEVTDSIIYDNSAFIASTGVGKLMQVWVSGSFTGSVFLEWDQTTDEAIFAFGQNDTGHYDFRSFGGIKNPAGSGATGDLTITSRALANLDDLTVIVDIDQS